MSKDKNPYEEEIVKNENLNENEDNRDQTMEEPQEKAASEEDRLRDELKKQEDRYVRLFAEFENYKRRTSRERIEMYKTAGQEVLSSMLPVLDDFDRAIPELKKSSDPSLLEGIELIHAKLKEALRKQGLEEMVVKEGDKFDADLHEAVTQIPAPKKKLKGKIIDVIQKGYILGEKIIRYPKVVTGA